MTASNGSSDEIPNTIGEIPTVIDAAFFDVDLDIVTSTTRRS